MNTEHLAHRIEQFIESNIHMAQRLYPDVCAPLLAKHLEGIGFTND